MPVYTFYIATISPPSPHVLSVPQAELELLLDTPWGAARCVDYLQKYTSGSVSTSGVYIQCLPIPVPHWSN